jgi:hypothetical protein
MLSHYIGGPWYLWAGIGAIGLILILIHEKKFWKSLSTRLVIINDIKERLTCGENSMNKAQQQTACKLTKESAADYFYVERFDHLNRLALIQMTLNDIEERLTRIEERLDK